MMSKLSHTGFAALIVSLAFQVGCTDDGTDQTSSTSADLSQTYVIQSLMNFKCLDLLGFNNTNGAPVGMWDCWGGADQLWYWNGEEIRSLVNNKCLDLLGSNNTNGAHVGMWDCLGRANQHWYLVGNQILSRFNNRCLDLLGFNNANGAAVGMWDCWGGADQQWSFSPR